MRLVAFIAFLIFSGLAQAASVPVLLGIEKLESNCQGPLTPMLQTLAISQNGSLVGTIDQVSIIRFDTLNDAVASRGRENNCVRLGNFIHALDLKTKTISYENTGMFKGVVCTGTCPGLQFQGMNNDKFWVDPVTLRELLGYTNVLNKKWKLNGLFRFQKVFAENPNLPQRYSEILVLKQIQVQP